MPENITDVDKLVQVSCYIITEEMDEAINIRVDSALSRNVCSTNFSVFEKMLSSCGSCTSQTVKTGREVFFRVCSDQL
jgi:hypothetical protein